MTYLPHRVIGSRPIPPGPPHFALPQKIEYNPSPSPPFPLDRSPCNSHSYHNVGGTHLPSPSGQQTSSQLPSTEFRSPSSSSTQGLRGPRLWQRRWGRYRGRRRLRREDSRSGETVTAHHLAELVQGDQRRLHCSPYGRADSLGVWRLHHPTDMADIRLVCRLLFLHWIGDHRW